MVIRTGRPQRVWRESGEKWGVGLFFLFGGLEEFRKVGNTVNSYHSGSRGRERKRGAAEEHSQKPRQEECRTAIRKGVNEGENNRGFVGAENQKWVGVRGYIERGIKAKWEGRKTLRWKLKPGIEGKGERLEG